MKLICLFALLSSCVGTSPKSPEGTLSKFIKLRFEGKSLSDLNYLVTDNFKEKMDSLSDTKYEELKNYKKRKFEVLNKQCSPETCQLTYYVSYTEQNSGIKEVETETKKIAKLVKSKEKWLIDEISHIKTYHDMINKLNIESK